MINWIKSVAKQNMLTDSEYECKCALQIMVIVVADKKLNTNKYPPWHKFSSKLFCACNKRPESINFRGTGN